jgi:hypothetical protein
VFLDVQFLKNEHKQIRELKELGYDGVFFITEEPKNHKIIDDFFVGYIKLGKSKKFLSLGIFEDILSFKENLNNYDLFLLDFRNKEDKMDYRNSLFSPSLAYFPKTNKGLLFPTVFFENQDFEKKAQILGRFEQNIKIIKKKKSKFLPIFCSLNYFEDKEKIDDYRDLFSLGKILGLHPKQARKSLGENLFFLYKQKLILRENLNKDLSFLKFRNY